LALVAKMGLHKTQLRKHDKYQLTDDANRRLTITLQRNSSSYQKPGRASALLVVEMRPCVCSLASVTGFQLATLHMSRTWNCS
jgi:hypothetical protein